MHWILKRVIHRFKFDLQISKDYILCSLSQAVESAEQVAELWHSTDEDLRNAARETILSFGNLLT